MGTFGITKRALQTCEEKANQLVAGKSGLLYEKKNLYVHPKKGGFSNEFKQ